MTTDLQFSDELHLKNKKKEKRSQSNKQEDLVGSNENDLNPKKGKDAGAKNHKRGTSQNTDGMMKTASQNMMGSGYK